MLLYSLFLTDDKGEVQELISLDVVTGFGEKYSASIPESPVESGFNVSDTINLSNPTFSMSGIISNSRFLADGHLIEFRNGEFVKVSEGGSVAPIKSEYAAVQLRERLIKLHITKEVFGILEYTNPESAANSQVRAIYPCAMSDLGFDNSDATDAIYPNMSIKNIRIAEVVYKDVKDAVPDLIPLMKKHQDVGVGSGSGEAGIPNTEGLPDANQVAKDQKNLTKMLVDQTKGDFNLGGDPEAHAGLHQAQLEQGILKEVTKSITTDVLAGKVDTNKVQDEIDKRVKDRLRALE